MTKFIIIVLAVTGMAVVWIACRKSSTKLEVGGIYSINDGDGRYGVAKLLAYGDGICHVRIYKQKFQSRHVAGDFDRKRETDAEPAPSSNPRPVWATGRFGKVSTRRSRDWS